jgi:membrane-bound lytic murein transglycosylase MltF
MPNPTRRRIRLLAALLWPLLHAGCGDGSGKYPTTEGGSPDGGIDAYLADDRNGQEPPSVLGVTLGTWHDDLDGLLARRTIRVLITYSKTHYFLDGLTPRGITADNLKEFSRYLHRELGLKRGTVTLLPIPVARDQMLPYLAEGLGDLAIGNLTVTPEREALADFSVPTIENVSEVVVTGPAAPQLERLEDLAGQRVFVRRSSSFRESLERLNARLGAQNLETVTILPANENLQTEDILELVSAGAVGITVADSHLAEFWRSIFTGLTVREDLTLTRGRAIGWAIRKDAVGLKPLVDGFVEKHRKGTLVGNMLFERYLKDDEYIRNAAASAERQRLAELSDLFQRYSSRYDFDWLMTAAQAYQESRLIQTKRSPSGAVGVMQILPRTARSPAVGIPDIERVEANVHAGHKYLRHLIDRYFSDPEIDPFNRSLFGFAAYNAGPTRINRIRRLAAGRGLDPNVWFGNVELLVAEQVGREPVQYVRNILKYYTVYSLLRNSGELPRPARAD